MSSLQGLEPLGLEEYDTPDTRGPAPREEPRDSDIYESNAAADATQMEENLGVEDLGVDDVLQTKVRRPQPKLDAKRLLNPHRGYPFLLEHLKKIPYRGKGDEKRYLKKYVNTYLIWANRLWPKANFDDFTVLARKAGKDPRIRQYCRELIEEEKYGGQQQQAAASDIDTGLASSPLRQGPGSGTPDVAPARSTAEPHTPASNESASNEAAHAPAEPSAEMASPPPHWESGVPEDAAYDSPPPDLQGPNEDEEAAAMELYGDLDM